MRGQALQTMDLAWAWYVPAAHARHRVDEAWLWYVPGPHALQLDAFPPENRPAAHARHAPVPAVDLYVPALHPAHAGGYPDVPGGQGTGTHLPPVTRRNPGGHAPILSTMG